MTIINAYQFTRGKAGGETYPGWVGQYPRINLNAAQRKAADAMWLLMERERKHTTTYEASLEFLLWSESRCAVHRQGWFRLLRNTWQSLETVFWFFGFFGCHNYSMLLRSGRERSGMQLNILKRTRQPPPTNVNSAKFRRPVLDLITRWQEC